MSNNVRNALIILVLILAWLFSGLFSGESEEGAEAEQVKSSLTLVEAMDIDAVTHKPVMRFNARTEPFRTVQVAAETDGPIISTPVDEGARVEKGVVLASINTEERELRVKESRAGLEQRKIEYKAALELKNKKLLSASAVAQAQAALEAAKANLEAAEFELSRVQIRAPLAGVFNERFLEQGDFAQRGQSFAELLQLDPLKVVFEVTESEILAIDPDAEIVLELSSGQKLSASYYYRSSRANLANRAFRVEALVDNPDNDILADLTGVVTTYGGPKLAHAIPAAVLSLSTSGVLSVKILDEQDKVEIYPVDIIADDKSAVWVTGLPESIRLITTGFEFVGVGEKVQVSLKPSTHLGTL